MSDKCKICNLKCSSRQSKINCRECNLEFHGACVKLSKEDVEYYISNKEIWRCDPCQASRRKSMQLESTLESDDVSLLDVMNQLREMRQESRKQIKDLDIALGESVESCHRDIGELGKKFDKQDEIIKGYEERLHKIHLENNQLKKKVIDLESRIDELEQYSRANCLEINGIPESNKESVVEVVKAVSNSLGIQIQNSDIDACHRVGVKRSDVSDLKPRGIIVKFTSRVTKEDILQKRKVKRNFNTNDIGIVNKPAEVIYINESLSYVRRQVFNAARKLKKDGLVAFVWVRNGRILVRAEEGSKVEVMNSLDDVENMRKSRSPTPKPPE